MATVGGGNKARVNMTILSTSTQQLYLEDSGEWWLQCVELGTSPPARDRDAHTASSSVCTRHSADGSTNGDAVATIWCTLVSDHAKEKEWNDLQSNPPRNWDAS